MQITLKVKSFLKFLSLILNESLKHLKLSKIFLNNQTPFFKSSSCTYHFYWNHNYFNQYKLLYLTTNMKEFSIQLYNFRKIPHSPLGMTAQCSVMEGHAEVWDGAAGSGALWPVGPGSSQAWWLCRKMTRRCMVGLLHRRCCTEDEVIKIHSWSFRRISRTYLNMIIKAPKPINI